MQNLNKKFIKLVVSFSQFDTFQSEVEKNRSFENQILEHSKIAFGSNFRKTPESQPDFIKEKLLSVISIGEQQV
jgi:hypothetical protein